MSNTTETPRIYVADLAAYNNGTLHGAWIDVENVDQMQEEINKMLRESPCPTVMVPCPSCGGLDGDTCPDCCSNGKVPSAEEWAIHDHDGFFGLSISEHEDLDTLEHMAAMITEHGEAWALWADNIGDKNLTEDDFRDAYQGEYDSEEDFAMRLAEDIGAINQNASWPNNHIDWEAAARDLFMGDYTFISGHVFHNI